MHQNLEGNLAAQFEQRRTIAKAQGLDETDPKVKNWIVSGGTLNEEGKPLPAELAARTALGGKFLDEAPAIRAKIETGMATDAAAARSKPFSTWESKARCHARLGRAPMH